MNLYTPVDKRKEFREADHPPMRAAFCAARLERTMISCSVFVQVREGKYGLPERLREQQRTTCVGSVITQWL
jgi:hypothetical protein